MAQFPLELIRQAVNTGEFDRAWTLWSECAAGMAEELSKGRLSKIRLSEVRELVEWSRVVVLCERAHLQEQLNRLQTELHVAEEYELRVPPPTRCLIEANF